MTMLMTMAAKLGDERSFETGVESMLQSMFGYIGRWAELFPDWNTKEAMELWFKDPEAFLNRVADGVIPVITNVR